MIAVPMNRNRFRQLAAWEIRNRRWVILGLAALTLGALVQLPRLQFDFRPEALLEFSQEEQAFARELNQRFQIEDDLLLIVLEGREPGSVLDARGLTLLYRLTERAGASALAARAISLATVPRRDLAGGLAAFALGRLPPLLSGLPVAASDVERVRTQVATSRMLPRQLVSEDGSTAAIVVVLASEYQDLAALDRPLAELQSAITEVLAADTASFDGDDRYQTHLGGLPYVRLETVRHLKSEQLTFWPMTAILYLSLLWFLYRDLGLAVIPLLAVGLASLWGVALLPLAGAEVNVINNIVPSLILVIGVCNAIHMLHAYAAARRAGADGEEAACQMMAELGLPVFLTSLTTAIGFASLLVARNGTLRDLGWQASAGIMLSYVALITLLPLAVSRFGDRLSAQPEGRWSIQQAEPRWLERVVGGVRRWPRLTLGIALMVLGMALASGLRAPVDALVIDTFPPGHPIYESNQLVEKQLGGILPLEIELAIAEPEGFTQAENLRAVLALQRELAVMPGVLDVKSLVDVIAEVHGVQGDEEVEAMLTAERTTFALAALRQYQPEALALFLSPEGTETRIAARLGDHGIQASLETLEQVDAATPGWLATFASPVTLRLTGEAYIASRGLNFFIRDLIFSLLAAGGVIFLVLVVVFRSLRLGLLSFLPTVLPLVWTLGLVPVYGYQLNTSTVVVFTISIGMAVDNTIHLLTGFRRARREGLSLDQAIDQTFRRTGSAVVASNLLLIGGFAILFASDFEPVFRVAALTTTTIGAAMAAAILVLPALLALWGRPIGRGGEMG